MCAAALLAAPVGGAQQAPARWTIDPGPTVRLAGEDPGTLLQTVTGATRLPDGSIMVGDRGDFALRIFSPKGALTKSFGRLGSGPGEVRYLARMFRCGDSVYTNDIAEGNRVSVFTLAGQYVRVFRFGSPVGEATPYASACNRNGEFIHMGWGRQADMKGGVYRSVAAVWTSRADSVASRIIDSIPGSERWGQVVDKQLRGSSPLPLGRQPVIGIGRSQLYLGPADRFQIRAINRGGQEVGTLERSDASAPVTPADVKDALELQIATAGERSRERFTQLYAEITIPKTLPSYTKLLVDANDNVWVRPYPRGGQASVRWSVFDAKGPLVAEVDLPAHLIGSDYVLGRYVDPKEGAIEVRMYRLSRSVR